MVVFSIAMLSFANYLIATHAMNKGVRDIVVLRVVKSFLVVQKLIGLGGETVELYQALRRKKSEEFSRRWLEQIRSTLSFYRRFILQKKAKKQDVLRMVEKLLSSYNLGRFAYLFVTDSTGRILYHPDKGKIGENVLSFYPSLRPSIYASQEGVVHNLLREPNLTVGWCKYKPWGWVIFTVVDDYRLAIMSLEELENVEKETLKERVLAIRLPEGYVSVYNDRGELIAYPYKVVGVDDKSDSPFVRKVLTMGSGYFSYALNGREKLRVFMKIAPYGWYVVLTVYVGKLSSAAGSSITRYAVPLMGAVTLALMVWIYGFVSEELVTPILAVVSGLQKVASGKFDYRVQVFARDEVRKLVDGFNEMVGKLDSYTRRMIQDRERVELLLEAVWEVRSCTSKKEIAERISRVLLGTEKYTHVAILIVDGDRVVPLHATALFRGIDGISVNEGIVGWSIRNRKVRVVPDVKKDPYYLEVSPYVRSEIVIPIVGSGREVIGAIDIESEKVSAFDKSDEYLLRLLAEFLYSIFKRVDLLDDWRTRVSELESLFVILSDVAGKKRLEEVSRGIVDKLFEMGSYHNVSLLLVSDGKLEVVYWRGASGLTKEFDNIDLSESSIVARAAKTGRLQNVSDVFSDPDYLQIFVDVRSELAVPISVAGSVIGVLNVESTRVNAFTQREERFISSLADVIAGVMHTAREYERAEKMYEELSKSYESLQKLAAKLEEKEDILKQANVKLEKYVEELALANAEVERKSEELEEAYVQTIRALVKVIERKDPYTKGHSERVARYSVEIGKRVGLDEEEQRLLLYAGLLHDIGKIGIREEVLNKPGKLTREEYEEVKRHPVYGAEIVQEVRYLRKISRAIMHHHERWDGSGYPAGLEGEEIPLFARIMAVADAYDAMSSNRSYRSALSVEDVVSELRKGKGSQFDPRIVDVFLEFLKEIEVRRIG